MENKRMYNNEKHAAHARSLGRRAWEAIKEGGRHLGHCYWKCFHPSRQDGDLGYWGNLAYCIILLFLFAQLIDVAMVLVLLIIECIVPTVSWGNELNEALLRQQNDDIFFGLARWLAGISA